ncbi:3-hydroxyacyl-CoA dehydrogenase family protein [Oceanobacillus piezotolerans]|uniref:L-gulonate 3-dehydrogenase n=1 Tax=Oceanobacillus piezotolerans TaxID=2448030 RepID=A0A498DI97_9BACI|nr:3-hydroxyacyl-CoA dehydrogenase family protein [Oceanobacillus piezotolerans]RLL41104.1 3-hydroxyacyl-CoA dehydrogenase family protein [Oceanobacillus piezotolerans]
MQKITVLGAGTMGHGIAQNYALAGFSVALYDLKTEYLSKALSLINTNLTLLVQEERIDSARKEEALNRITVTTDLKEAVGDTDFITETIIEVLDAKHQLYRQLDELVPEEVIIASNTSTFSLEQLTKSMKNSKRFIITHFFNPAQLVPLVEIVKRDETPEKVVDQTVALMKKIGKEPVVLQRDIPGFIANRLQAALVREAFHLLEEGVADAKSIDLALTAGPGFRWAFIGPLETADYGGLDIWKSVVENLAPELSQAEKVPSFINEKISQGKLGTKAGEGIYNYSETLVEKALEKRDRNFIRLGEIKGK